MCPRESQLLNVLSFIESKESIITKVIKYFIKLVIHCNDVFERNNRVTTTIFISHSE